MNCLASSTCVKEAGQISWNDAMPTPTLLLPTQEQEKIVRFMEAAVAQQEKKM